MMEIMEHNKVSVYVLGVLNYVLGATYEINDGQITKVVYEK